MTPQEQAQFIALLAATLIKPNELMTVTTTELNVAINLAAELYVLAQAQVKAHPLT